MNKAKPVISIILAAVFWGFMGLFVRKLSAAGIGVFEISLIRVFISAIFMLVIILFKSPSLLKIKLRDIWMFIGTGLISLTLFNLCYFSAINLGDVSIAVVLLYTSPIWVMFLSAIFFKEKITAKKLVAVILTFTGCALVSGISGQSSVPPLMILLGLASGFCYSLYSIFGKVALEKYDSYTVTFYTFAFSFAGLAFISDWKLIFINTYKEPSLVFWELGVAIICAALPYLLYTWGLEKITDTSRAAVYATVEPVVGAIIGIAVFHESASPVRITGMLLIIGASILLSLTFGRKKV